MKESHVVLRLIASVAVAVVLAIPAYYYFIHIVPAPKEIEAPDKKKMGEIEDAQVASEALPPGLAKASKEKVKTPGDLVNVDIYICNPISDPENAEYTRCSVGFADEGIEMFSLSKEIPASALDEQVEKIMKDVPIIPEGDTRFTCISAQKAQEGDGQPQHVLIADYSDKPAPPGNLYSNELKGSNRCMEGYTEHKGIFTGTVPKGYHAYNYLTPPKGDPNYRIIY